MEIKLEGISSNDFTKLIGFLESEKNILVKYPEASHNNIFIATLEKCEPDIITADNLACKFNVVIKIQTSWDTEKTSRKSINLLFDTLGIFPQE